MRRNLTIIFYSTGSFGVFFSLCVWILYTSAQNYTQTVNSLSVGLHVAKSELTSLLLSLEQQARVLVEELSYDAILQQQLTNLFDVVEKFNDNETSQERARARAENLKAILQQRLDVVLKPAANAPTSKPMAAILNQEGVVMISNSSSIRAGSRYNPEDSVDLAKPMTHAPGINQQTIYREISTLFAKTLASRRSEIQWIVAAEKLSIVAAYPLLIDDLVKTVFMIEIVTQMNAHERFKVLLMQNQMVYGSQLEGLQVNALVEDKTTVIATRLALPTLFGFFTVPVNPFFVSSSYLGVLGLTFGLPIKKDLMGIAYLDCFSDMTALSALQYHCIFLVTAAWLLNVIFFVWSRLNWIQGVHTISHYLSRIPQMKNFMPLSERAVPQELRVLSRLVNTNIEKIFSNSTRLPRFETSERRQTSIEDIIHAHGEPTSEVFKNQDLATKVQPYLQDDLKLSAKKIAAAKEMDGYKSIEPFELPAMESTFESHTSELPDISEALAAVERMQDDFRVKKTATERKNVPKELIAETTDLKNIMESPATFLENQSKTRSNKLSSTEEQKLKSLFDEFNKTRLSCGEALADLSFDKFVLRIEQSKSAVLAKHNCLDVNFQVYVKNGKAALRAIPL